MSKILEIHHVTQVADEPQTNVDFHAGCGQVEFLLRIGRRKRYRRQPETSSKEQKRSITQITKLLIVG